MAHRFVCFAAIVILAATGAHAAGSDQPPEGRLQGDAAVESASVPEPVFVAGVDSGGAGERLQPGPGCKLAQLCVNDSICHEIWQGFWACVWMEDFACDSIWCESGE